MKEMIYKNSEKWTELLHNGKYKGYNFCIYSYGIHPCAYVEIPKDHPWYGKQYYEDFIYDKIVCHGGLTFSDYLSKENEEKGLNGKWFIGWDYAHAGDYEGYNEMFGFDLQDKKWTTEEIFEEVKNVIDQLVALDFKEGRKNYEKLIIEALKGNVRVNIDTKAVEIYNDYGTKIVLRDLDEETFEAFKNNFTNF